MVCCFAVAAAAAQPPPENRSVRPFGEVLREAGERFAVRMVCKRFAPGTVQADAGPAGRLHEAPLRISLGELPATVLRSCAQLK